MDGPTLVQLDRPVTTTGRPSRHEVLAALDFAILEYTTSLRVALRPSTVRRVGTVALGVVAVLAFGAGLVADALSAQVPRDRVHSGVLVAVACVCSVGVLREASADRRTALAQLPARRLLEAVRLGASASWIALRVLPLAGWGLGVALVILPTAGRSPLLAVLVIMTLTCSVASGSLVAASSLGGRAPLFRPALAWGAVPPAACVLVALAGDGDAAGPPIVVTTTAVVGCCVVLGALGRLAYRASRTSATFDAPLRGRADPRRASWTRRLRVPGMILSDPLTDPAFRSLRRRLLTWGVVALWLGGVALLAGPRLPGELEPARVAQASYATLALGVFATVTEVNNRSGVAAQAARFRWLRENGIAPRTLAASLVAVLVAVGLTAAVLLSTILMAVVHLVGVTASPWTLDLAGLCVAAGALGVGAPLVAEGLVDSPSNPDGTKRIDFVESLVGGALVLLPVLLMTAAPSVATVGALVLAVLVLGSAVTQPRKGIRTCRAYCA